MEEQMSTILKDFKKLSNVIPDLKINELINFYENLPLEKYENRMQHFLECYYFPFGFDEINEFDLMTECKEIQAVLPFISRRVIKCQLIMVGNVPDRKAVVIKQILQQMNFQKSCQKPTQSPLYNIYNKVNPVAGKRNHFKVNRVRFGQPVTIGGTLTISDSASDAREVICIPSTSYADDVIIDDNQNEPVQINDSIVIDDDADMTSVEDTDMTSVEDTDIEIRSEDGESKDLDFNKIWEDESNFNEVSSSVKEEPQIDFRVYSQLMEIFPDACKDFLRKLCLGKKFNSDEVNAIISKVLSQDYPKRPENQKEEEDEIEMNFDKQYEMLKEILPDADPTFLRIQLETFSDQQDLFKAFVYNCLEMRNYPTMKEYLRKQQLSAQMRQYTQDFSIENFIKIIPDPKKYFSDKHRKNPIEDTFSQHYAKTFLRNRYPYLRINDINQVFENSQNLWVACRNLDKLRRTLKHKRKAIPQADNIQDIPLLQEIAYIEHKDEIDLYIKQKELNKQSEFLLAKMSGKLLTCQCCYDDEILPNESAFCEEGCVFCVACVRKSVEIKFGEGKLDFFCLTDCDSFFSLKSLQSFLEPKMFSKIALKKQLEEVKAAGIEDLEMCPFCDFATIPPEGDKIFHCLNPECMKESCRLCKEPSHIPLKCDEVEKDADVRRRVFVENKMTEAILRKCYKCDAKFIKTEGCNKMTCVCGAMMCYICSKPVKNYKHFNGQGGDQYHLCPLFSDSDILHKVKVLEAADTAKAETGGELKHDPTKDTLNYYERLPKKKKANPIADNAVIDQ